MNKPVMIMMAGLVGSGKSFHAEKLAKEIDATVFSSDKLREEMFDNVDEQNKNGELFQELHKRIKDCLKSGKNAIYDATNINRKRRRSFLQELNKIDCEKRCVIIATPYEQCIVNNAARDRNVPEEVIDRMYRSWNTPHYFEGFDCIEAVYWGHSKKSKSIYDWIEEHKDYGQDNPHHELTLGQHCLRAGAYCLKASKILGYDDPLNEIVYAGLTHDCGKFYVKSFVNSKNEQTEVAHYYNHENVGAYDSLFYDYGDIDPLDVSILVNLHMKPYAWERDNNYKLQNKNRALWGDNLYNKVMALHEADKSAH